MALVSIDRNPSPASVRSFALLGAAFCAAFAVRSLIRTGVSSPTVVWTAIAVAFLVVGFLLPKLMRIIYVGSLYATFPIGWAMSHVILAVVFYGLFTPIALVFRLNGRDSLRRKFDPSADSYWTPKTTPDDPRRYLEQF